ncbi:MAG: hypothetical protein JXR41_15350, partial [Bacteroidales bacterium]|nr:hypothetical protein [Bacteroidales bacterium]
MRKVIFLLISFFLFFFSYAQSSLDSLKLFEYLNKENIKKHTPYIRANSDCEFDLNEHLNSQEIDGFCISGSGNLFSDSSMIKVLLKDRFNMEYLVLESSAVFDEIGKIRFKNRMEETFLLDGGVPQKLIIQLSDASIEISEIITYNYSPQDGSTKETVRVTKKREIENEKLAQIRKYIEKNRMIWYADHTDFSSKPYSSKKKFFGEKFNSYGFEYYRDGFFSTPSNKQDSKLKSITTYADGFDWRNRHGQDWMTPNKCQSGCWLNQEINCNYHDSVSCANAGGVYIEAPTCWAFAAAGALEANVNLYFNQHIDHDLSEQQVVSCALGKAIRWYIDSTLDFIINHGIVTEECYPYLATGGDCNDVCQNPSDIINFSSFSYYSSESDLKYNLIHKGTMPCKMYEWAHAIILAGYGTVQADDYIDFLSGEVIQEGDPNIGKTYWILKQSNTHTGWPYHTGYIYMLDKPEDAYSINVPITSQIYESSDIMCTDNDNDGYCWWGIGSRPASCNSCCCAPEPDGDDSNPNLGPMDSYGNCQA